MSRVILRDRCSTLFDLASLFRGRGSTLNRWDGKIILVRGCQLCTQLSILEGSHVQFSFLTLSNSKIEEVSQNCFVLAVAKIQKLKTSR